MPVTSILTVSRGLEYNLRLLTSVAIIPHCTGKGFRCVGGGPNPLRFHFSTPLAALIQFRAYDCNTKTERVVIPETAMMNAPLLCLLVCFAGRGEEKGGGSAELNFMLSCRGAFFLTASALLLTGSID